MLSVDLFQFLASPREFLRVGAGNLLFQKIGAFLGCLPFGLFLCRSRPAFGFEFLNELEPVNERRVSVEDLDKLDGPKEVAELFATERTLDENWRTS